MQTSIRVEQTTRDELARIAGDLGGVSLDEALRVVLFRHRTMAAVERLAADPAALADYQAEARDLAEADVDVHDR